MFVVVLNVGRCAESLVLCWMFGVVLNIFGVVLTVWCCVNVWCCAECLVLCWMFGVVLHVWSCIECFELCWMFGVESNFWSCVYCLVLYWMFGAVLNGMFSVVLNVWWCVEWMTFWRCHFWKWTFVYFARVVGQYWECRLLMTCFNYATTANYSWIFVEGLYLHTLLFVSIFSESSSVHGYIIFGWSKSENIPPGLSVLIRLQNEWTVG